MDLPSAEQVLADAADYLIEVGQTVAARALLSCSLYFYVYDGFEPTDFWTRAVVAHFIGPDEACRIIGPFSPDDPTDPFEDVPNDPVRYAIWSALQGYLPSGVYLYSVVAFSGVNVSDPTWRTQLAEKAQLTKVQEPKVDNQAPGNFSNKILTWNSLRFRSETERRVAAALERAGVMFLPNCRVRLGPPNNRQNREGDFLICHEGKWGVLEVDGEPYHPPSRKAQEDERDRLFKLHGVRVVEHFDAKQCFETPLLVVKQFLAILKHS